MKIETQWEKTYEVRFGPSFSDLFAAVQELWENPELREAEVKLLMNGHIRLAVKESR